MLGLYFFLFKKKKLKGVVHAPNAFYQNSRCVPLCTFKNIDRIMLKHFGFSKIKVQPCNISSRDTEGPYVGATCAWAQTLS